MTVDEVRAQAEDHVRLLLRKRFDDRLTFNPIEVRPCMDHDGDKYLHIYVVFKGDQGHLDPAWTVRLPGLLWDLATDLEFPGVPVLSFVEDAEWEEMAQALADETF